MELMTITLTNSEVITILSVLLSQAALVPEESKKYVDLYNKIIREKKEVE